MRKNNSQNKNNKSKKQELEEILAKESPELLLKMRKYETESPLPPPLVSEPFKLLIFIGIVDLIAALVLGYYKKITLYYD